jgi:hypothetical protein
LCHYKKNNISPQQQQQPPPTFLQAPLSLCFVLFFPSCLLAYCVANPIAQKDIETHKTKANKQTNKQWVAIGSKNIKIR